MPQANYEWPRPKTLFALALVCLGQRWGRYRGYFTVSHHEPCYSWVSVTPPPPDDKVGGGGNPMAIVLLVATNPATGRVNMTGAEFWGYFNHQLWSITTQRYFIGELIISKYKHRIYNMYNQKHISYLYLNKTIAAGLLTGGITNNIWHFCDLRRFLRFETWTLRLKSKSEKITLKLHKRLHDQLIAPFWSCAPIHIEFTYLRNATVINTL